MGRKAIDLSGRRFGRLTVVERADAGLKQARWRCACECGGTAVVASRHLRTGMVKGCGCLQHEAPANKTHGRSGTRLYKLWRGMITRCTNPRAEKYPLYGGRGIRICDRWRYGDGKLSGFECFLADVGEPPAGTSLDRYPNNDGHYEPGNTRWATALQQRRNRREYPTMPGIAHNSR